MKIIIATGTHPDYRKSAIYAPGTRASPAKIRRRLGQCGSTAMTFVVPRTALAWMVRHRWECL